MRLYTAGAPGGYPGSQNAGWGMMDYDISEVDDREKFPPKVIWVYWDYSGEHMDQTADPEQGEHWERSNGEHVFKYVLA